MISTGRKSAAGSPPISHSELRAHPDADSQFHIPEVSTGLLARSMSQSIHLQLTRPDLLHLNGS